MTYTVSSGTLNPNQPTNHMQFANFLPKPGPYQKRSIFCRLHKHKLCTTTVVINMTKCSKLYKISKHSCTKTSTHWTYSAENSPALQVARNNNTHSYPISMDQYVQGGTKNRTVSESLKLPYMLM